METMRDDLSIEALSQAVRVSLANGGNEATEDTVKRASAFHSFLSEQAE